MYTHVPTGFVPQEDQNYFITVVQAPQGASLAYTTSIAKQAEQILRADPDVFGTFAVPGFSLTGGSSSNYGLIFAPLKPIDERKGKGHAASDIVARVGPKLFSVPGAIILRTARDRRYRQLRRLPVPTAGPRPQHAPGPRLRRSQNCGGQPPTV
jgi:HAE1 family hydrophobic/amphiphilic exporter-1